MEDTQQNYRGEAPPGAPSLTKVMVWNGGHIMQRRLAQDLQTLAWRRNGPPKSGAVHIAREKFLRDGNVEDAASWSTQSTLFEINQMCTAEACNLLPARHRSPI